MATVGHARDCKISADCKTRGSPCESGANGKFPVIPGTAGDGFAEVIGGTGRPALGTTKYQRVPNKTTTMKRPKRRWKYDVFRANAGACGDGGGTGLRKASWAGGGGASSVRAAQLLEVILLSPVTAFSATYIKRPRICISTFESGASRAALVTA